ncbi:maleylpyruvate isomerase family mycothiol-dependent enzyme [Streptomyces profundus]|uniref:maleylpyruvate isomerase family mycothiol-dependent enzyme n=1 Tax=Streptomyces profundus TaxID=2867410 RepID=UPI001D163DC0|nr:maleylpyruvate isomerase family mycothiol-dependent enzyme [Streptomyces sp. MA3_2.13]UED84474.1 maleylpyruvate isomerase family mycothiol-dependent enzyme [Streptomyces sp. MA3_2.13]
MDSASLLHHLRTELTAFRACLDGDPSAPVAHCGDWTLRDLAEHLGGGNVWAATAVTEQHGDGRGAPAPRERAALARWFDDTSATLLTALDADPAASAWTFHPPHTVGFWRRRRALETLVHRWDAESALGVARPLDPLLAGEGVAEVFDTMAPRQVARGRVRPPSQALRLTATDTGASWAYGPGGPVATLSAPAEQLLLLLWGRIPADSPALHWSGDHPAALAFLAGPLTP